MQCIGHCTRFVTNFELACGRPDVVVESVHFSDSLLTLSYLISQRENMEENP